jgi:hypothetical protein
MEIYENCIDEEEIRKNAYEVLGDKDRLNDVEKKRSKVCKNFKNFRGSKNKY